MRCGHDFLSSVEIPLLIQAAEFIPANSQAICVETVQHVVTSKVMNAFVIPLW